MKPRIGMVHSQYGEIDGVSIVMKQTIGVLKKIGIADVPILCGKNNGSNVTVSEALSIDGILNKKMIEKYEIGLQGMEEEIEQKIKEGSKAISEWIDQNRLDVIIAHNSCHPINFMMSLCLSRYFKEKKDPPRYVLWWHDSHLERDHFSSPARDVKELLLESVPGPYPDFIIFINSTQLQTALPYFKEIEMRHPGYLDHIKKNNIVIHNTSDLPLESSQDIQKIQTSEFKRFFGIEKIGVEESDLLFCLQNTRILRRKRIDFAIRFGFELLKRSEKKAMYFFISGESADDSKEELIKLHRNLSSSYEKEMFLVFAEDYHSPFSFSLYPLIFSRLGGFTTFFSEVEGFGNNLLEVLAAGLIPVIYSYPVFKTDIEQYGFNIIATDKFEVDDEKINQLLDLLEDDLKRNRLIDDNIKRLKSQLAHENMIPSLKIALSSEKYQD